MTRQANLPGPVAALSQVASTALGMEYLTGVTATTAVASIVTPTFPARDTVMVLVGITGTSVDTAHAKLRFNADSAANYWYRTFISTGLLAGLVTFTNNGQPSKTEIDLENQVALTGQRMWLVQASNRLAMAKTAFWQGTIGSATLGATTSLIGVAEWVNTTAQITSVSLVTAAGTLTAGTRLQVYGRQYP